MDGRNIHLPSVPEFASNENGYMDASNYQTYAPLGANSVITASASDPSVEIRVGDIVDGRAVVTCVWKGQKKVYKIN